MIASSQVLTLTIRCLRHRMLYCGGLSIRGGGGKTGPDSSHNSVSHLHRSFLLSLQLNVNTLEVVFENSGFKIDGLVLTFQLSFALSFASVISNVNAPNVFPTFRCFKRLKHSGFGS